MSLSMALQLALRDALMADPAVALLVDDRVFDNAPPDAPAPYLSFGPSDWVEDDADCIVAREETVQIDAWSRMQGSKASAKDLCDAVFDALHLEQVDLGTAAVASLYVERVRVLRDPDGITAHGVVTVRAMVEVD